MVVDPFSLETVLVHITHTLVYMLVNNLCVALVTVVTVRPISDQVMIGVSLISVLVAAFSGHFLVCSSWPVVPCQHSSVCMMNF